MKYIKNTIPNTKDYSVEEIKNQLLMQFNDKIFEGLDDSEIRNVILKVQQIQNNLVKIKDENIVNSS